MDYLQNLGSLAGYCQDRSSADGAFTPAFDLTGVE